MFYLLKYAFFFVYSKYFVYLCSVNHYYYAKRNSID